jgi:hypothetical protein
MKIKKPPVAVLKKMKFLYGKFAVQAIRQFFPA